MKIDLDTLIYIIVMIVFIILGAVGKKKKPVQQVPPSGEGEEDYTPPEDIIAEKLRAFLGNYDQEEAEPVADYRNYTEEDIESTREEAVAEAYYKPVEVSKPEILEEDEILDKVQTIHDEIQEGSPVFETYVYDDHSELIDGDLTKSDHQLSADTAYDLVKKELYDDFDLAKAIIYSEIILKPRH